MSEPPGFRPLGTRHVERGRLLGFERRHYVAGTGMEMVREIVRHPGSVAVVPVIGPDVLLIRQHRTPVDRAVLEIPAGLRDHPGEDPASTAARELEEEVGRRAGRIRLLRRFYLSPGFTDEQVWLYLADGLEEVPVRPHGVEERTAEVVRMSLDEALERAGRGEIEDAKTLIGLALAGEAA